jgi:acetyltransferase-like isoleucine patch superfamily enzyme
MAALRVRYRKFVRIARGVFVDRPVRFSRLAAGQGVSIGARTTIYRDADITGPVSIGEDVFINRSCYIRPKVVIHDRASLGPYVRLITDWHIMGAPEWRNGPVTYRGITIGEGSGIGAGVTILPGVTIGKGAVVAAGSVVTKDVPPNVMAGGVPAKVMWPLEGAEPGHPDYTGLQAVA